MALISGIHRQITLDRQESDRLAEGASNRLSSRIHECEQRQQWFDCRMAELSISISDINTEQQVQRHRLDLLQGPFDRDQLVRPHAETDGARQGSEQLHERQRSHAVTVSAAIARDEDVTRSVGGALTSPHRDTKEANSGTLLTVRDLETSLLNELRIVHARCDLLQRVIHGDRSDETELQRSDDASQRTADCHGMDSPMNGSRRLVRPLECSHTLDAAHATNTIRMRLDVTKSSSLIQESCCTQSCPNPICDPISETQADSDQSESYSTGLALVSRLSACETAQREMQRHFTECSTRLGQRIQLSLSDVRGHLDTVMKRLGELNERVQRQEEVWLTGDHDHGRYASLAERMQELDDCVRQNAAVAVPLCSSVTRMQESLADVKRSISMALLERRSAMDSPSLSTRNTSVGGLGIAQAACASVDAFAGTVCSSNNSTMGLPGHLADRLSELPEQVSNLTHRTACVEGLVANIEESLANLSVFLSGRSSHLQDQDQPTNSRSSHLQDQDQPTNRDLLPELVVATPPTQFGSSCSGGGLTPSKHAIEGLACRARETGNAWAQADAVLEIVEGIVARQQRELKQLTASLQMQTSIEVETPLNAKFAAASDALDTSEPCSKATTSSAGSSDHSLLRLHDGCSEERTCLEIGTGYSEERACLEIGTATRANVPNFVLNAADATDAASPPASE